MESKAIYRYPGSRPFEDTDWDRQLFFGREKEKEELFQRIIFNRLMVLHGVSGLGKTSLLNAGVFSLLRQRNYFPIKVRFNMAETDPIQAIYHSIDETVKQQQGDMELGETETLWHYFKTVAFWSQKDELLTPVLILDQFEEFFAFHEPEVRGRFIQQLADLVHNTIPDGLRQAIREGEPYRYNDESPRVKIVISIRSDYLGQLDELSAAIPEILLNRYRLLALTRTQAREAIIKPAQLEEQTLATERFGYTEEALQDMLDYLSKRNERGGVVNKDEIESFQLQLLCRHIETNIMNKANTAARRDNREVQKESLGGEVGMYKVFQNFYEEQLSHLKTSWEKRRVRRLCEKGLISDSDRRLSLEEEYIENQYKVSPALLALLVDKRLLRAEQRVGSVYYELSHDTLIKPIRLSQRKRREIYKKSGLLSVLIATILFLLFMVSSLRMNDNKYYTLLKEAKQLIYNSKPNEAIVKYNKALALNNKKKDAYEAMAKCYAGIGEKEKAIDVFKKAIRVDAEFSDIYEEIRDILKQKNDIVTLEKLYGIAFQVKINDADYYCNIGICYFELFKFDAAIASFQKALKIKPNYAEVHAFMGISQFRIGEYNAAIASFQKAQKLNPDLSDSVLHSIIAITQWQRGDYDSSKANSQKALNKLDTNSAEDYTAIGLTQILKGEYDTAIANTQKALMLEPNSAEAYSILGLAIMQKGDSDTAIACFQKALNLKPDFPDVYLLIGGAQIKKGDYDAAIASCKKALELNPNSAEAYLFLGNLFNKKGKYDSAIKYCQKAINLNPNLAIPYRNIGYALAAKKDFDAALTNFQKALKIDPTYYQAKMNIAELDLINHRFDKAIEMALKVLKSKNITQEDTLVIKSILITAWFCQGNKPEALSELRQFRTYYRSLTVEYERNWSYQSIKKYLSETKCIDEPTRALLLKMIALLEAPKAKGDKLLSELEKKITDYSD